MNKLLEQQQTQTNKTVKRNKQREMRKKFRKTKNRKKLKVAQKIKNADWMDWKLRAVLTPAQVEANDATNLFLQSFLANQTVPWMLEVA
jgi:hypothetical protein